MGFSLHENMACLVTQDRSPIRDMFWTTYATFKNREETMGIRFISFSLVNSLALSMCNSSNSLLYKYEQNSMESTLPAVSHVWFVS